MSVSRSVGRSRRLAAVIGGRRRFVRRLRYRRGGPGRFRAERLAGSPRPRRRPGPDAVTAAVAAHPDVPPPHDRAGLGAATIRGTGCHRSGAGRCPRVRRPEGQECPTAHDGRAVHVRSGFGPRLQPTAPAPESPPPSVTGRGSGPPTTGVTVVAPSPVSLASNQQTADRCGEHRAVGEGFSPGNTGAVGERGALMNAAGSASLSPVRRPPPTARSLRQMMFAKAR